MTTPYDSRITDLVPILKDLGLNPDERKVVCLLVARIKLGRTRYGELDLSTDRRDWRQEGLEECIDGLVYAACGMLK